MLKGEKIKYLLKGYSLEGYYVSLSDIPHQGKPSGSSTSSERTSYTHATLRYLSNQKHALFKLKWRYI